MTLAYMQSNICKYGSLFMTVCEELKRFKQQMQSLQRIDFIDPDIVSKLLDKAQAVYQHNANAFVSCLHYGSMKDTESLNTLIADIRRNTCFLSETIKGIAEAHSKEYKDENAELIRANVENEKLKDDIRRLQEQNDYLDSLLSNRDKKIDSLLHELACVGIEG